MGLIKALTSSVSSGLGDQFKEFVECPQIENDVMIARGVVKHGSGNSNPSEGVISNGSAIVVPEGMAAAIIDNGKVVEFTAEAGTFTWDTSSEPSIFTGGLGKGIIDTIKTIGSRITFGGQTAKDQRVYYINIKPIPGNTFGSMQPEPIYDPVYGSVEITYNGEYTIKLDDPIVLFNTYVGANAADIVTYDDVFTSTGQNILKSRFAQKISEAIAQVMEEQNISFNRIQGKKSEIIDKMNELLSNEWKEKYGLIILDVALRVNASEESAKIVREMDAKVAETTRMGEVYSNNMTGTMAAATGEAMKGAASNGNGAMMGFAGMNMAQGAGANVLGAAAGIAQAQGTVVCPSCGANVNSANFCNQCGAKLN